MTIGDALEKAFEFSIQINEMGECEYTCNTGVTGGHRNDLDSFVILHRTAGILCNSLSGITFQKTNYPPSDDVQCKAFIIETLYDFVTWCTSKYYFDKTD